MKNMIRFVLAACVCFTFASCTGINGIRSNWYGADIVGNTNPVPQYSNITDVIVAGGALFHLHSTPGALGNAKSIKTGRACSNAILWLAAFGDSSIGAAADEGGIKKIASVTHENIAFLGFGFHKHCTVVTGE